MAVINNNDILSKYKDEKIIDYEEFNGKYKKINYKRKSIMITHDHI